MIILVKGDINKLKGNVVSYTKFDGDIKSLIPPPAREFIDKIIPEEEIEEMKKAIKPCAFFGTSNESDFVDKMGPIVDCSKDLIQKIKETQKEMKKHEGERVKMGAFYMAKLPNMPEEEILRHKGDIVYAGTFAHPEICVHGAMIGLSYYQIKLADKMISNIESGKGEIKKEHELEIRLNVTCKDIPKNEFQEFVYKNYVIKMMDAKRNNRRDEYKTIQEQFISFGKDTHFQNDILDLCRLITSNGNEMKDSPLIDATIKKIDAINKEDFLAAAKYRDEVNLLRERRK